MICFEWEADKELLKSSKKKKPPSKKKQPSISEWKSRVVSAEEMGYILRTQMFLRGKKGLKNKRKVRGHKV